MKARELIRRLSRPTGDAAKDVANLRSDLAFILQNLDTLEPLAGGNGDLLVGVKQLNTGSVKGFLYVPRMQGGPTGTPTNYSAGSPVVFDETTGGLFAYDFTTSMWVRLPGAVAAGFAGAQTGAIASLATFTSTPGGVFRISPFVLVTTSTTFSFNMNCAYTDRGGTARTLKLTFYQVGGTAGITIANAGGAVPYHGAAVIIQVKAGTTITISTSGTFTSVTYDAAATIEQVL